MLRRFLVRFGAAKGVSMIRLIRWGAATAHSLFRGMIPLSLLSFLIVGALGVVVHLSILKIGMNVLGIPFRSANALSMVCAATFNFCLNNLSTFRDKMLGGRRVLVGYALYMGITSLGLIVSLSVSSVVYSHGLSPVLAALCGIVVGSLWNYCMSYTFVWRLLSMLKLRRRGHDVNH